MNTFSLTFLEVNIPIVGTGTFFHVPVLCKNTGPYLNNIYNKGRIQDVQCTLAQLYHVCTGGPGVPGSDSVGPGLQFLPRHPEGEPPAEHGARHQQLQV